MILSIMIGVFLMPIFVDPNLIEHVKAREGFREYAYYDRTQFSIGFGCLAKSADETITLEQADLRLRIELQTASRYFDAVFSNVEICDARRLVLTSMIFNMGMGDEKKKTGILGFRDMRAAIHEGDWNKAADEALDSKWASQVGERAIYESAILRTGEM